MTNVLKVSIQTTIFSLSDQAWSRRRIARELRIHRKTVGRHLALRPKPAIAGISIAGKNAGRKSLYEPLAQVIGAKVEAGLSGQRIYQDLVLEHGFGDSYQCVQRFVRALKERQARL